MAGWGHRCWTYPDGTFAQFAQRASRPGPRWHRHQGGTQPRRSLREQVDYVIKGRLQAATGQSRAARAAVKGGIPMSVPALTINKVCLSGMDAALPLADQLIRAGEHDVIVAYGMESMTNAPHALVGSREGAEETGDWKMVDTMAPDGLLCIRRVRDG